MSDSSSLLITNSRIVSFYKDHPEMDFESNSILMIELIEKMLISSSSEKPSLIIENIQKLQGQIVSMSENIQKIHPNLLIKMADFKREYIDDLKMILQNNTSEKIAPLIKEYNASLLDKSFIMIQGNIKESVKAICEETNKMFSMTSNTSPIDKASLDELCCKIDGKFSSIISSLSSSEIKMENKLYELKEMSNAGKGDQQVLQQKMSEIIRKFDNSSSKGKMSENVLFHLLHSLYPCSQIDSVGGQKETGDIMLIRKDKPIILIENKDYGKNVGQEEVKKFIRDIEMQKCCGLFLSQNYGIANKENFEINIHNGNVLLYVHQANNDPETIRIAIDIIDHFKIKLDEIKLESGIDSQQCNISTEILDEINKEYQIFFTQKVAMIKLIKEMSQKMLKQSEELCLPSLEKFLTTRYAFSSSKIVCEWCGFQAKNNQSLSAHQRGKDCKKQQSGVAGGGV